MPESINLLAPSSSLFLSDSFADRRVKVLRNVIRCGPLFAPKLPAVLVENNGDTCPVDKDGRRLLPDGSQVCAICVTCSSSAGLFFSLDCVCVVPRGRWRACVHRVCALC